jgi:A/G-specific adenine glycosylase
MSTLDRKYLKRFQRNLLRWFQTNGRSFPWRKTRDPYRIILAEMLLQKTNVEKVLPVYRALVKKYPRVQSLANANLRELKAEIRPLGLLYRAKRMKRMAQSVAQNYNGHFPKTRKELRQLYGVGDYMTNAVRAFAYGEQVPIVDTNVIRIFDRVFGLKSKRARARTDKTLWEIIGTAVPQKSSREFNLALLDFAALVCTHRAPKCRECPMQKFCRYFNRV